MEKKSNNKVWIVAVSLAGIVFFGLLVGVIVMLSSTSSTSSKENNTGTTVFVEQAIAAKSVDELIEESSLVAVCTLKEESDAFQIESVTGGISIFTDYYFEVGETYRGEAPENKMITVRRQGGTVGDTTVEVVAESKFEVGQSYLLFLYQPSWGGGFNTGDDYYYIRGDIQGIYPVDSVPLTRSSDVTLSNVADAAPIEMIEFQTQVEEINEKVDTTDVAANDMDKILNSMEENVRTGMMTQEEYDAAVEEMQQYATYVGDPPAGYSGNEE